MRASGGRDASIRLTVTRGIGPAGVPPPDDPHPTVIVAVNPLPVFPAAIYDVGLTAHVASGRRNERAMTAGLKTLAYADAVAAWLEARRAGADEALFLDIEDHCSEATSSNLFVWTDSGTLVDAARFMRRAAGGDAGRGARARTRARDAGRGAGVRTR